MQTNEELLSFESPMELAFVKLLADRGYTFYESRSMSEAVTPWGEVTLITGRNTEHLHRVANGQMQTNTSGIHDEWISSLQFTITTNRPAENTDPQFRTHKKMIGAVRALCSIPVLRNLWPTTEASARYGITDIFESGSTKQVDEENRLDITVISFDIRHNIRPDAWPDNL